MTGIKRILLGCLGALGICVYAAYADDSSDAAARAATRRDTATTVSRTQSATTHTQSNSASGISRATNVTPSTTTRTRTQSSSTRDGNVVSRDTTRGATTSTQSVSARTGATVLPRTTTSSQSVISVPSRAATTRGVTVSRTAAPSRSATQHTATPSRSATTISRAATTQSRAAAQPRRTTATNRIARAATDAAAANEIIQRDYTTCREVYYSCMDEFCANKDSQLKRCACSSRVNEFDDVKAQLSQVEDKLLDFNQRLLTVNMDKEDALAISQATEGELAFQQEDTTASKELLDEISEKLNTTFETDSFDANLAPISLSLNIDAAFDSVDSLAGSSTTTKSGTELYSAALPVCREMAMEVCTADELDIVESGYQMAIEQDCNTVAKAYQTQQDLAREKIREGSALLDISRLNTYQTRNSDDILTCKKKMLDLLTNTAVCGDDLEKCLDISGQYIDPSTGEAILTKNLVNLGSLITRPTGNQTWTSVPGNDTFVRYLNSKKMFLESATENCQDIADYVWDEFIDDALAQIKLAQDAKLEEVRQSCTTLTTQCLTNAYDSLEEFDARALSIFGVEADKTAKQMCAEVQTACTALLDTTDGGVDWSTGMTDIAADKTYETILQTCREVGRACIIQSCKSISGNFGLCDDIDTSVNRKAIINRTACWDEVVECVTSAGITSLDRIAELHAHEIDATTGAFYPSIYGNAYEITHSNINNCINDPDSGTCIYDICENQCGYNDDGTYSNVDSDECRICRMSERIWGNCEGHPASSLANADSHNAINMPLDTSNDTLLSWFAKNTNTEDAPDACRDTSCGPGFIAVLDPETGATACTSEANLDGHNNMCSPSTLWQLEIAGTMTCCKINNTTRGSADAFGNCCHLEETKPKVYNLNWFATSDYYGSAGVIFEGSITDDGFGDTQTEGNVPTSASGLCIPADAKFVAAVNVTDDNYYPDGMIYVLCVGTTSGDQDTTTYPAGQTVQCSGRYLIVAKGGTNHYMSPNYENGPRFDYPSKSYFETQTSMCNLQYDNGNWDWVQDGGTTTDITGDADDPATQDDDPCGHDPARYIISYPKP